MKTKQNKWYSFLWVLSVIIGISACQNDEAIPLSVVKLQLNLPQNIQQANLQTLTTTFININTGNKYEASYSAGTENVIVIDTLPEGLYRFTAEGKMSYTFNDSIATPAVSNIRAYKESLVVTGAQIDLAALEFSFYNPSAGFVIEEIYFTGSTTPTNDQYSADQYIKIYNNSADTLYADGIAILESLFHTVTRHDYTPDIMNQAFSCQFAYVIPGSGEEHPVAPGQSLLIALNASNHTEANSNSFDLSQADFEFYDESSNPKVLDTQNPNVPDLDKWYAYTATVTGLHNRGFNSYALAKMECSKEEFLANYAYTAHYLWVFGEYSFPSTDEGYYVPNSWIIDAVNLSVESEFQWIVTDPSLDAGWTHCGNVDRDPNRYNKSVRRKVERTENGRKILKDTNNSTQDFEADATPSLKE